MAGSQSIDVLLDGIRLAYQEKMDAERMNASKKTRNSFRKEVTESSGILYGAKNLTQLKYGRRPGRFPPIDDILDWIREKGITPRDNKTTERDLAFLFARKISQKGTDIYQGKRPALDVEDRIKELFAQFTKSLAQDFRAEIIKALQ